VADGEEKNVVDDDGVSEKAGLCGDGVCELYEAESEREE